MGEKGNIMQLKETEYGGEIRTFDKTFIYRKGTQKDAGQLAGLYRQCAVHKGNYREKLCKDSGKSFEKSGGMFLICQKKDIERELENPHSLWAVVAEGERIAGSFWISDENALLDSYFIKKAGIQEKGRLAYPREIIVDQNYAGMSVGQLLFYTVFAALEKNKIHRSLCDVYRAVSYAADEKTAEVNLLNRPSYLNMLFLGGSYQGAGQIREIKLNGLRVRIEPQVFLFRHKKTIELAGELFAEKGIEIHAWH